MVGNPLVSLVMPTFNRPALVLHGVKLFLEQSWTRSELIVVDDSDQAHQVDLSAFPRVKHVKLGSWHPMGTKHNMGLELAQGEILGYWDDDDWFHPRRLVKELEPLVMGQATVVGIPRGLILDARTGEWWKIQIPPHLRANAKDWVGNGEATFKLSFHDGTALYARQVLRHGFLHTPKTVNQKADFLNAITDAGEIWKAVPNEDLFVYVRHGSNTWRYQEAQVHVAVPRPIWFPVAELEAYRKAVA